jgi:hypothetical protein
MVLDKKEISFEDQLIIEKSMNLWINCILYKVELLEDFYNFKNE